MDNPIPIMLHGGNGRMATAIRSATLTLPDVQLLAAYPSRWDGDRPRPPLPPGAILVDFTHADALLAMLEAGAAAPFPILTGTSGLNDRHHALLRRFAQSAPVLQVSNFCLGAMIAADLVARISKVTAPFGTWDAAVTDLHNVNKVDRPSATAEAWSHAWGGARGGDPVPIVSLRLVCHFGFAIGSGLHGA